MREYISSDTNIWLDFDAISRVDYPFKLSITYIMYIEALREEVKEPADLMGKLEHLGLEAVDLTVEEFFYADEIAETYRRLSGFDRTALAIAKKRGIALLTGDEDLRKAAKAEGVEIIGTIGILDRLYGEKCISKTEYKYCLEQLRDHPERRLPGEEINKRLKNL